MMEFSSAADLTPRAPRQAIKFANTGTGQEVLVEVQDKFPQMGEVHIEGRRVVECSVEFFVGLMAEAGWTTVVPELPPTEKDPFAEFTEEEI